MNPLKAKLPYGLAVLVLATMYNKNVRTETLARLQAKLAAGKPIIGGGAGTGISAKCEEAGGIDLIVIYNSGRFRMAGRGSLAGLMPYGNANEIVREMASEVLTAVREVPVPAGVCATDPFMIRNLLLKDLKELGFAGIQNFPTVGLIDGTFRANLEEGMSYQLEVDCIRAAREMDLLTTPYVFDPEEAKLMTHAGADIVVAHMGLTTSGTIGAFTSKSLDECVKQVQAIVDTCKSLRPETLVLCHGGPIATPKEAQYLLDYCQGLDGFYGASSLERLPTEHAIVAETKLFTALSTPFQRLAQERGLQAASRSAISCCLGFAGRPRVCAPRKRRKRRAPFFRAASTLNTYWPEA